MNNEMMKLLLVRNLIPNLTMEAFLSTKPGMVGAIGFQKIAQSHAEVSEKADTAETKIVQLEQTHNGFADNVARIALKREPGTPISAKDRAAAMMLAEKVASTPLDKRDDIAGDNAHAMMLEEMKKG